MSEDARTAILAAGFAFCILFAGISLVAIVESGQILARRHLAR